jgi:hypothetical protein
MVKAETLAADQSDEFPEIEVWRESRLVGRLARQPSPREQRASCPRIGARLETTGIGCLGVALQAARVVAEIAQPILSTALRLADEGVLFGSGRSPEDDITNAVARCWLGPAMRPFVPRTSHAVLTRVWCDE